MQQNGIIDIVTVANAKCNAIKNILREIEIELGCAEELTCGNIGSAKEVERTFAALKANEIIPQMNVVNFVACTNQ